MKDKKTAVLVYGEFREFEYAHKTWSFLKYINFDLYFSTWNITEEVNDLLGISIYEEVTPERILKYFPKAIIDIRDDHGPLSSPVNKMLFHWRNLFNMMTFSGVEYDSVIILRPDIYIKEFNRIDTLLSNLKEDRIYGLSEIRSMPPPMYAFVQDCMFIGKPEKLKWSLLTFTPPDTRHKDIHYHLSIHFLTNFIYVESIQFSFVEYYIMRSINRNFIHEDFELQKRLSVEWFNAKYNKAKPSEYYKLINKWEI